MLAALDRLEDALLVCQESVELYRALYHAEPEAFVDNLAISLSNLSIGLGELGRRPEALQASQEAVELRRTQYQAQPEAFAANLATDLNNLAIDVPRTASGQTQAAHPGYPGPSGPTQHRTQLGHCRSSARHRPSACGDGSARGTANPEL